jgi:predicted permease
MFRSFYDIRVGDPGFRRDGVLLAAYDLSGLNQEPAEFARRLLDRIRALPGVDSAAIASSVPLDIHGMPQRGFTLEGRVRSEAAPDQALSNTVTRGYFETMGIARTAGDDFAEMGDTAAPAQAVVNDEFVRRFVSDGQVLGRRIQTRGRDYLIVGVVRDSLYDSFNEGAKPMIYLSYRDRPSGGGEIHVRTRPGAEAALAADLRRVARELDAALPLYNVRTMATHIETNLFLRRIPARMFVVLGPMLLLLAAIGIYAVVSYAIAHRTAEIGVRLALGAASRQVILPMVGESMVVVGVGALFGWVVALMIDLHLVRGGVSDVPILVGVPMVLVTVAAIACWIPARRATTIDPVSALRHE